MSSDVLIVGGGLAGLAAAHRLLEHDVEITLVEKRQRLGGRASSYDLDDFPLEIDNCQHILTGSCRYCLRMIRTLVGEDSLRSVDRLPVWRKGGDVQYLKPGRGPVPFHLFSHLRNLSNSFPEAVRAGSRLLGLRWADPGTYPTAGHWLRDHQPVELIRRLWWPLTVSALNETPDRLALRAFQKWIFTGLVDYRDALTLYFPADSLKELYSRNLGEALEDRGLDLRRSTRVKTIDPECPAAQLENGDWIEPEALISALPDRVLWARLSEEFRDQPPYDRIPEWDHAPIVSVHLLLEKNWDLPEFLLLAPSNLSSFEWMFSQRQPENQGTYVQVVKSAAREMVSLEKDELVKQARGRLRQLLGVRPAVEARQVVKEKNATLSLTPETLAEQFGPSTPEPNFYVAGDWIRGGWPPTMEAAVRSGYRAANRYLGRDDGLLPEPRPEGFLRFFQPMDLRT